MTNSLEDKITPDFLLKAYMAGLFPMAEDREDQSLFWVDPDERGILPLNSFHISKSLKRAIRKESFKVTVDQNFKTVMQCCAEQKYDRPSTWISNRLEYLYCKLHDKGYAHSVECWNKEGHLVGGLYGVSIKGAFFGESMFHRETNASKIALVYLVARLITAGYDLLDTQFNTEHLKQFGVIDIPRQEYLCRLDKALHLETDWFSLPVTSSPEAVLHAITQIS